MTRSVRQRPLKVGLVLPMGTALPRGAPTWLATSYDGEVARWPDMLAFARMAEDAGFDSLWVVDHLHVRVPAVTAQFGRPVTPELERLEPIGVWECWSLLAALAAVMRRVELGTIVSCTGYRNPALLAKIADTVDEISGGRLILGLGAGDYEDEHHTFGFRWDRRVTRFEEALAIILPLLRTGQVDFAGEYYSARDCELRPRGPRPAGPSVLIGSLGHGPRMLDLVARNADQWNGWLASSRSHPDVVAPLRDAVDTACVEVGRDPATLVRTLTIGVVFDGETIFGAEPLTGSPEELAEAFRAFAREGIGHVQVWLNPMTMRGVEALAPVLELLDRGAAP
jgi:alkanesulfonate monooxygenase SsuD/methylene tetrahydromethanopterin reductase-like flavin-dependent oxidoreductase (luciferase family)